ncbi:tRNA (guanine(37)-N1)-methyltransferase 1-like isoform X1 [Chenopodium quinoa]|uniref:tRNA (guanine(37)-N1)-methyltransferase n=1 Tax=Chenopodium quinoa TaxID=63459 RepID=A0A803MH40_CHEQI|nr:tRNA (guanine(37)-N1)-methyltransferase 1-like isoform X1 [Chenopodium quinoa]
MFTQKLMLLRFHSHFLAPPKFFPKLLSSTSPLSLRRITAACSAAVISSHSLSSISYGPSLQKGTLPAKPHQNPILNSAINPPQQAQTPENGDETPFEEDYFTRVFEIAAIRVPSERCFELEGRIRGHLLNWPRVSNIARVPGDEIDEEVQGLLMEDKGLGIGEENEVEKAVSRRIYGKAEGDGEELSGVLYRDKLAKEFNARGFVKFRNLAKISRPNRKKKRRKERQSEEESRGEVGEKWKGKRSVMVEVVEESEGEGENVGGDLSGLLGDEFMGRKWRGSTRLLLLDERYAGKKFDELPEAVKAAFIEGSSEATKSSCELVRCNLTLSYDYWSNDEVLEALLPKDMIIPSAFETVGHIAHLNLKEEHLPYKKVIAKVVLDKNKPKIQTVVNKIEAISNDFRTMELEVLAGNHSLVVILSENGLRFQIDLAKVYWNSRLSTERQRLISCFTSDDVLCDVFSGVGPIAISAAKKVKRVYANDLNPYAVDYLERNTVLNKLERKIKVYNMDGRRFIEAIFLSETHPVTQVVMNLPNDAVEFLDAFRGIFSNRTRDRKLTLPKIHVYGFSKAEDPEFDFHERIRVALEEAAVAVEMRRVRAVAPGKWMLCASFVLPEKVAFSKSNVDCK